MHRCAVCENMVARKPGERPSDYKARKTCSRKCGYILRGRTISGIDRRPVNDDILPPEEVARICGAPFARQRREYEQAGADAQRLFAPDIRSFMEGNSP